MTGWSFIAAGLLFWLSWVLMPGVGIVDPAHIFAIVATRRGLVLASVVLQLISAAAYAPALVGLIADVRFGGQRSIRVGAALLAMGAMGSAADAVLHLLAFAMTAPGRDPLAQIPVMAFMQGPGLVLLAPMLLAFFAGGACLSVALARIGVVSRWNVRAHPAALAAALSGLALAGLGAPAFVARLFGLAALGLVGAAHAGIGWALRGRRAVAYRQSGEARPIPRVQGESSS
jgi:hypothetical protein